LHAFIAVVIGEKAKSIGIKPPQQYYAACRTSVCRNRSQVHGVGFMYSRLHGFLHPLLKLLEGVASYILFVETVPGIVGSNIANFLSGMGLLWRLGHAMRGHCVAGRLTARRAGPIGSV
jgi:hypothetical protein